MINNLIFDDENNNVSYKSNDDRNIEQQQQLIQEMEASLALQEKRIAELEAKELELNNIINSYGWRSLIKIYHVRNQIMPVQSRRWRIIKFLIKFLVKIIYKFNVIFTPFTKEKSNESIKHSENQFNLPVERCDCENRSKKILLISFYCPSKAHAGGLRILDIYSLIKETFPNIILELYTIKRPDVDWDYDEAERIFDRIYWAENEVFTVEELINQAGKVPFYDLIDFQFHEAAKNIKDFRQITETIIYTPMELLSRAFYLEINNNFSIGKDYDLRKWISNCKYVTEEILISHLVDKTICVSKPDADFLKEETHNKTIYYLETGISSIEFTILKNPDGFEPNPNDKKNKIVFVAYFGSETNRIALKWYLDKVHPLIKAAVPDYVFSIVGRGDLSAYNCYRDSSVVIVGEVPELGPYIEDSKVGIAPALSGAGFRGKINQYAIYGLPSVVSPIAARGLAYQDGYDIYVGDEPSVFAEKCIDLLRNPGLNQKIGLRARETCLKNYTWESKLNSICDIYNLRGHHEHRMYGNSINPIL